MTKKVLEPGTASFINEIAIAMFNAVTPIIDVVAETQLKDGYPPLTEPTTVRDLMAMPLFDAVELLVSMYDESLLYDEVTGQVFPDPAVQKLIADFLETLNRRLGGVGVDFAQLSAAARAA